MNRSQQDTCHSTILYSQNLPIQPFWTKTFRKLSCHAFTRHVSKKVFHRKIFIHFWTFWKIKLQVQILAIAKRKMKLNWKSFEHNRISSRNGSNRKRNGMKLNLMNPTIRSFQIENWLTQFSVHEVLIASNEWNYAPFKWNEVKKVVKMSNLCYVFLTFPHRTTNDFILFFVFFIIIVVIHRTSLGFLISKWVSEMMKKNKKWEACCKCRMSTSV